MRDVSLNKIRDANMHLITHGSIKEAVTQAEDYLRYMLGFNEPQIQTELNEFVAEVKNLRRESRG